MKQAIKNIFIILTAPEKQKLWLLAFADVVISLLDIAFLLVLLYVIRFYTQPGDAVSIKGFSLAIFKARPVLLITVFFVLFAVKNTAGFFVARSQYQFVYKVATRLSGKLIRQYLEGTYQDFVSIDSSVINRNISQAPIEFSHYVLNGVQQVFSQAILILITIGVIVAFNPLLFPLLLLILAPPVCLIVFLMKRKLASASRYGKQTAEKTLQHLQEALNGFVESNIYQKNDFFVNRYHRFQVQLNRYLADRLVIQSMPPRLIEVFAVFGLLVLVTVNFFSGGNSIDLVTIGALMIAAYKIIPGIVKITNISGQVKAYAFAATDLAGMAAKIPEKKARAIAINSIAFKNVSFDYPGKQVLSSFCFCMKKGDFAVVTGVSGQGKTTFINLLLGFLTPSRGVLHINGVVADAAMRQAYWAPIAYVKQQVFFLHASITQNITLQEADFDKEKLQKITALSGIDNMVTSLPEGLETVVSENGKNFSGGQRQRIVFARALYKASDLLILDEPFNELDEASELAMLEECKKIAAGGKMIILVTHNKAAVDFGNQHVVLREQR